MSGRHERPRAVEPIAVTLTTRSVEVGAPLADLVAVRTVVGEPYAFLLESLSGPVTDTRSSMIGITGLVEVAVRQGALRITGIPALAATVQAALIDAGVVTTDPDGMRLVDDDGLWQLPRVLDALFEVERSDRAFGFGLLAYYGYDAVRYIEALPRLIEDPAYDAPDAVFALVHGLLTIDLETNQADLVVAESAMWPPLPVEAIVQGLAMVEPTQVAPVAPPVPPARSIDDDLTREQFLEKAATCLEHIRVGDIYQVQLGHEIAVSSDADPLDVYRRLRVRNPSPYMCVLQVADATVLGASPEMFVRMSDRTVTMRPIAGTARRPADPAQEAEVVDWLLHDEKERAEHVMLVDLCRNDLGRIAEPMSVEVADLMVIEAYSHMFHIVSNVTARVAQPYDIYDVIRASFPAGTMTGAPKIRAMEIIESLETSRRGLYAGAFGVIGFGGWAVLGLGIRMVAHRDGEYRLRASAGMVADSVPANEWQETLTKLGATYWAVTGEELS